MCPGCGSALVMEAALAAQSDKPVSAQRVETEPKMSVTLVPAPHSEEPGDDDGPLYAARRKIYPQSVHGTFRKVKWTVLIITLGIY